MLIPTFRLHLNRPMLAGLATVGKFDGIHPSIACATTTDNVLVHCPHQRDDANEEEVKQLAVQQTITALTCGEMSLEEDSEGRDIILVGTAANLLAYDIEHNSDVFFKDMDEGISAVVYGSLPSIDTPLAIVGGPCSLYGFDAEGMEQFWTVTGDRVSALAMREVTADHKVELLVGSEDFAIRMYSGEEMLLQEIMESDIITGLAPVVEEHFAFALANHTIGIYNNETRVWHAKCKHNATCISAFDLDNDGKNELIAGWSNGRMEVRKVDSGSLVYKSTFANSIAALLRTDYRLDGREQIIACAIDGEIKAYLPAEPEQQGSLMDVSVKQKEINDLYQQKQALVVELADLEASMKNARSGTIQPGALPRNANLTRVIGPDPVNGCWQVTLTATPPNQGALIKLILIFSDQLFEGESKVICPDTPTGSMTLELKPKKKSGDVVVKLQVVVGMAGSQQDHVYEIPFALPKFAAFAYVQRSMIPNFPKSHVTFSTNNADKNRLLLWFGKNFMFEGERDQQDRPAVLMQSPNLDASFVSLLDGSAINISLQPEGFIKIYCDDMELVGDVVQDLCSWLQLHDVASTAEFPECMEEFKQVLGNVLKHDAMRVKLAASMADASNVIKTLVIKAEDARLLGDTKTMSQHYLELYKLNKELLGTHTERADNHQQLLSNLKLVNQMIQKAARLRCGTHKAQVVAACRDAIQTNSVNSLIDIFRLGHSQQA